MIDATLVTAGSRHYTRATRVALALALAWIPSGCDSLTEPEVASADADTRATMPDSAAVTIVHEPTASPNTPPLAIADAYATTVGVPLAVEAPGLMANDLDPDGDEILVTSFTPPANGELTRIVTTGAFTYEPDAGFVGTDGFSYRLRDGEGNLSEPAEVTIEVLPDPNRGPVAIPDFYATLADVPLAVEAPGLMANDLDPDGDDILVTSFTPPTNGELTRIVTTGAFTYEPEAGFVGTDAFTYSIRDEEGNLSEPVEVTIEVLAPGSEVPVAVSDAYATTVGVPLAVEAPGLMANDLDPDGDDILVTSFTPPANGQLTRIVTTGAFTYEPEAGFVGTDGFSYRLRDGEGNLSEPAEVTIEVLPDPNRGPVAIPDFYATLADVPLAVEAPGLMANDLDPDGDDILVTSFTPPANGELTRIVTTGAFTYEPEAGFVGTDAFSYRIRDEGGNLSEPTDVVIVVTMPDRTPPEIDVPNDPLVLRPPNHRYHRIRVEDVVQAVLDEGDANLTPADVIITRVTSDEPDDGADDGSTLDDIVVRPGCRAVDVRAERQGMGNGRVYVVELGVVDVSGNVGSASVEVHVPVGPREPAVRDAPALVVDGVCPLV